MPDLATSYNGTKRSSRPMRYFHFEIFINYSQPRKNCSSNKNTRMHFFGLRERFPIVEAASGIGERISVGLTDSTDATETGERQERFSKSITAKPTIVSSQQ